MAATKPKKAPRAKATDKATKRATTVVRPVGRPKSTIDLPDGWQQRIIDLYAEGAADVEVKALISQMRGSFSNGLWDRWLAEEPEFSQTVMYGQLLAEAFLNRAGRQNLATQGFNARLYDIIMRNRYNWNSKVELSGTNGGPLEVVVTVVGAPK
jgi:hypothetical protein